jgi:PhoPQ-activated pathogenicity-related protein
VIRLLFACIVSTAVAAGQAAPDELSKYIAKPEPAYAWKLGDKAETDGGTTVAIKMTSQTWQGITWEHDLQLFVPKGMTDPAGILLFNTGGVPSAFTAILGQEMARKVKAPVAILYGIPKQPLFGGKKEDALIAETFVQYLDTGDATWPLLFPMTKSVVKAMDTLQAYAKQEWKKEVKKFVVTGASKRGWTSWLTAATGDERVVGIAPMVIDTLNFGKQMPHQVEAYGKYSEMIKDYEERKLLPLPDTDAARELWLMVDPWAYRGKLQVPKLLIHGTNDPYWTQDALRLYWDDLPGQKHVRYVPNAGHDLRPSDKPNQPGQKKETFPTAAIDALTAFASGARPR